MGGRRRTKQGEPAAFVPSSRGNTLPSANNHSSNNKRAGKRKDVPVDEETVGDKRPSKKIREDAATIGANVKNSKEKKKVDFVKAGGGGDNLPSLKKSKSGKGKGGVVVSRGNNDDDDEKEEVLGEDVKARIRFVFLLFYLILYQIEVNSQFILFHM